ncbi:MAG: 3-hydroxyacyl-CoA dehydrogenase family protein, partial [Halalkalicoccus sp.]
MNVAVLGAGTVGSGIAQASATAGHDVVLRDVETEDVERGLETIADTLREEMAPAAREEALARITGTSDLAAIAAADLVVEAVPEEVELKKEAIAAAERATDGAILASHTSSLPLTGIASALSDPSTAIGLHFFGPVHVMDLVEIVVAERTSDETRAFVEEFVADIEKEPIVVRDAPGFTTSRLGVAVGVEAIRMLEQGVAGPRAIDRAMALGY